MPLYIRVFYQFRPPFQPVRRILLLRYGLIFLLGYRLSSPFREGPFSWLLWLGLTPGCYFQHLVLLAYATAPQVCLLKIRVRGVFGLLS